MVYKQLVESNGLQSNKQTVESDGLQTNKQLNPIFYKQTIVYKQQLVKSKPTHSNKRKTSIVQNIYTCLLYHDINYSAFRY